MGTAEAGSWKLLMYPIMFLVVMGLILGAITHPFTSEGIEVSQSPSFIGSLLVSLVTTGNFFNVTNVTIFTIPFVTDISIPFPNIFSILPDTLQNYLITEATLITYVPDWIGVPIALIIIIAISYALYVLATMLIP